MSLEDKLNYISKAEYSRIKGPINRVYCLDNENFDANIFCNEVERVFGHNGKNVMEALKYSILGIPTHLPASYREQVINDILALDDFLKDKTRYNKRNEKF